MRHVLINHCLFLFFFGAGLLSSNEPTDERTLREVVKTYSMQRGYDFADELKNESELFDLEAAIEGIRQYMKGGVPKEDVSHILNEKSLKAYEKQLFEWKTQKNLEEAEGYLEMASRKATMHVLEKGSLIYEILEHGEGTAALTEGDTIKADYTLFNMSGKIILSSLEIEENETLPFALDDLLPSLSRAMVGMLPGEKRKIYVHPNLAYGKIGHLPPNSLLIMEIKLLEIVKKGQEK